MSLTPSSNKACDKASLTNIANIANVAKIDALTNKPYVHARAASMRRFNLSVIALMALMMTACQSPLSSTLGTQAGEPTTSLVQQQTPTLAKTALANALKRQRHSSYAYHMNALASNEMYRSELASATAQQLAMSDNADTHCSHMHDEAYVDMLKQAEAENKEVADDAFSVQRQALKAAFLKCQTLYDDWEMAQYKDGASFNLADYVNLEDELMAVEEEGASEGIEGIEASADGHEPYYVEKANASDSHIQQATQAANDAEAQAQDDAKLAAMIAESKAGEADKSQAEFLPHYDSSHTRLDKRRATLLNDYLLAPLTVTSQGIYRPLSGQLSMSPNLQYNIRNLQVVAQHYIYVDAKEGAIYMWADTLAPMLSYYLDDKLGTQMHNKWIKLDVNDGSLPVGFGREVIQSHFLAIDRVRANSATSEYGFISAATLLNTDAKPHSSHVPYLVAPKIIERRMDQQSIAKDLQTYRQTLYQTLTDKYPELKVVEANADDKADADVNIEINDVNPDVETSADLGADVPVNANVMVVNTDATTTTTTTTTTSKHHVASDVDSNKATKNDAPKSPPLNSLLLVKKLLALIKVDSEADDSIDTLANKVPVPVINGASDMATTAVAKAKTPPEAAKNPNIDYAIYVKGAADNRPWTLRDVYGLDNRQNIQWHLRQYQNPINDTGGATKNDTLGHLTYEALTRYSAVSPLTPMFATLPQDASMPNADNTINFNSYSQDLMQRYENGSGSERGKIILKTIKEIGSGLIP